MINFINIDVKVLIDGNNLYLNCLHDSKGMLKLFETTSLLLKEKKSLDELFEFKSSTASDSPSYRDERLPDNLYAPDIFNLDYACTPKRVAQVASLYINERLMKLFEVDNFNETVREVIRKQNIDIDPENILFQTNYRSSFYAKKSYSLEEENFRKYQLEIDGHPVRWISEILSNNSKRINYVKKLYMSDGKTKKKILNRKINLYLWLIEEINSLTKTKLIIKKSNIANEDSYEYYIDKIHQYLCDNNQLEEKLIEHLSTLGLEGIDKKHKVKFHYTFNIHKAASPRKNLTDRDIFYKELKSTLINSEIINGVVKYNNTSKKEEEKEVDVSIAMLATHHMASENSVTLLLTNDSDFGPLLDYAKTYNNLLRIVSVTRKDRIAKRFRESSKILFVKAFSPYEYMMTWFKQEHDEIQDWASEYDMGMGSLPYPPVLSATNSLEAHTHLRFLMQDLENAKLEADKIVIKSQNMVSYANKLNKEIHYLAKDLFGKSSSTNEELIEHLSLLLREENISHKTYKPLIPGFGSEQYELDRKLKHDLYVKDILNIINKLKNKIN